jgi:hypothetical protein
MAEGAKVLMDLQGVGRTRYRWLFIVVGLMVLAWIATLCVFGSEVVWMTAFLPGVMFAIGLSIISGSLTKRDHMGDRFIRATACGLSGGISAVAISMASVSIMITCAILGLWAPQSVSFQYVPLIIVLGGCLQFITGFVVGFVAGGALEIAVVVVKIAAGERTPEM